MKASVQDAPMTGVPEALSDDGLYFYETCVESDGSCVVRVDGPGSVLDYVFSSREGAAGWIEIHGRACDLAGYEVLRSARSTHRWALANSVALPEGRAERLAVAGGVVC